MLWWEHARCDKQHLAQHVIRQAVKGVISALAGVCLHTAAPAQQAMERAGALPGLSQLRKFSFWASMSPRSIRQGIDMHSINDLASDRKASGIGPFQSQSHLGTAALKRLQDRSGLVKDCTHCCGAIPEHPASQNTGSGWAVWMQGRQSLLSKHPA